MKRKGTDCKVKKKSTLFERKPKSNRSRSKTLRKRAREESLEKSQILKDLIHMPHYRVSIILKTMRKH